MFGSAAPNYVGGALNLREFTDLLRISSITVNDTEHFLFQRNVEFKAEEENVIIFP